MYQRISLSFICRVDRRFLVSLAVASIKSQRERGRNREPERSSEPRERREKPDTFARTANRIEGQAVRRISNRDRIYSVFRSTSLQTQSAAPPESKTSSSSSSIGIRSENQRRRSCAHSTASFHPCSAASLPVCLLARHRLLFVHFVSSGSACLAVYPNVPRDLQSSLDSNVTINRPLSTR